MSLLPGMPWEMKRFDGGSVVLLMVALLAHVKKPSSITTLVRYTALRQRVEVTVGGVMSADAGSGRIGGWGMLTNPQTSIGYKDIWTHTSKLIPSKPQ